MDLLRGLDSRKVKLSVSNKSRRFHGTYGLAFTQFGDFLKNRDHSLEISEISRASVRSYVGWMLDIYSAATARQRWNSGWEQGHGWIP